MTNKPPASSPPGDAATQRRTAPVEVKPAEVKPAEVKPAEVKPAEVKPVEAKAADRGAGDTRGRILEAAADLLRRHGPAKTTVVDVARALDMSHANVYRHFASKAALQDAVAQRWLKTVTEPLKAIAREHGDAAERLERWVLALAEFKRRKVLSDPELFATYHALALEARSVADEHVAELHRQVAAIIRDGMAQGILKVPDAEAAARAVLNATIRFHHPHHVRESGGQTNDAEIKAVMRLLLAGLRAGAI